MIAKEQRLMASPLYRVAITRPWVLFCCYTIIQFLSTDNLSNQIVADWQLDFISYSHLSMLAEGDFALKSLIYSKVFVVSVEVK